MRFGPNGGGIVNTETKSIEMKKMRKIHTEYGPPQPRCVSQMLHPLHHARTTNDDQMMKNASPENLLSKRNILGSIEQFK